MWRAWSQRRLRAETVDRLLAAVLLVWALFDVPWWWRPPGHGGSAPVILGVIALAAAQSVPFLWRRQQPVAVLALAGAALAVKYAAGLNIWSAGAAVLAAAYGLGAYGSNTVRRAARVLAACALLAVFITLPADNGSHDPAIACALLAIALGMGEVTSAHRDTAAAAARHAQDMERARLARELHDVVAHQLSAIAVQAGAARLAAASDPQAAVGAIAAIERQARDGLARSISCACRAAAAAVSRCALVTSPMPSAMASRAQPMAGSWLPLSAGNVMKTASSAHAASTRAARRTVLLP